MDAPVALVTGGGSGIGLAVAEHLINLHGYKVAIVDIDAQRAAEESVKLHPQNCLGLHADISDYGQQSRAFLQAFEWGGNRLDLVFLNAGIGDSDSIYKDQSLDPTTTLPKPLNLRTIDVNLTAVIQGVHLARHFFTEKNHKKGGRIIATSSVVGLYPNYAMPLYATSKHGLVGLVRSCAPVFLKDAISINALCPTLIYTNLMPKGVAEEFHDPAQTTPMSTVLKAFDAILGNGALTGQCMELTLEEVVFKQPPVYSRENTRWMFGQMELWERVCEGNLPRRVGENAVEVAVPEGASIQ